MEDEGQSQVGDTEQCCSPPAQTNVLSVSLVKWLTVVSKSKAHPPKSSPRDGNVHFLCSLSSPDRCQTSDRSLQVLQLQHHLTLGHGRFMGNNHWVQLIQVKRVTNSICFPALHLWVTGHQVSSRHWKAGSARLCLPS